MVRYQNPLYPVWKQMRQRCNNPNNTSYERYGGRGIRVCKEWDESFDAFEKWARSHGYEKGLHIERVDNSGNYTPHNCTYATPKKQARNRRSNVSITAFGETKLMQDWADDPRCVLGRLGFRRRIKAGIPPETAITAPKQNGGRSFKEGVKHE